MSAVIIPDKAAPNRNLSKLEKILVKNSNNFYISAEKYVGLFCHGFFPRLLSMFHQNQKVTDLMDLLSTTIAWSPRITCSSTDIEWKRTRNIPRINYKSKNILAI